MFLHSIPLFFQSLVVTIYTTSFNIHKSYVLPTECIYVFCMSVCFSVFCPIQHWLTAFYKRDRECSLRGTNWVFKYNIMFRRNRLSVRAVAMLLLLTVVNLRQKDWMAFVWRFIKIQLLIKNLAAQREKDTQSMRPENPSGCETAKKWKCKSHTGDKN
jgi:hypothetical protein